jgi:uncharacterized protein (DUF2147 family)
MGHNLMNINTLLQTILLAVSICSGLPMLVCAAELSPVGHWQLLDEETERPYAIVEISESKNEYLGHIRKIFPQPGETANPLCTKCSGEFKDKPMLGMQIMSGLQRVGNHYDHGVILDPDEGKTYSCQIKILEDGKKLAVLFYIGSALFGYPDTWL